MRAFNWADAPHSTEPSARVQASRGFPPLVADDAIVWSVGNGCPSDIDCSGVTDSSDLNALLAAFESDDPCDFVSGGVLDQRGDLNGDDAVNSDDLNIMLADFGDPCANGTTGCASTEEAAGGGGGAQAQLAGPAPGTPGAGLLIAKAFGFDSIDDYTGWIDNLDTTDQLDHIEDLKLVLDSLVANGFAQ